MKDRTAEFWVMMYALVVAIVCAQSAPAQTFKRVKVKGGAVIRQVASGGSSVWARASNGNPYILKGKQFVLADTVSLGYIVVGGGNTLQADTVWGLDSDFNVYHAARSGSSWSFAKVPGILMEDIFVGPGYQDNCHPYEVWGFSTAGQIFRYNFCGKNFEPVAGGLGLLSIGGGGIWGINTQYAIFRFNFSTLHFDEVPPGTLWQIVVGSNGVWGLNGSSQIFQFYDNVQSFLQLPGFLTWIKAGGDGVWGLDLSGHVFRLEPSTSTFVQIPGSLASISVGSGGGVWGTDGFGGAVAFSMP